MENQYAMVRLREEEAEPAKSSRRSDGRRIQEATTRPVKMIGATSMRAGSPAARWEAAAPVMLKNMPA